MKSETLLYSMPLWVSMLLTVALIVFSVDIGRWFASHGRFSRDNASAEISGAVIPAMLALVAFMLALTFSIALNRFDARKQLLVEEVNAIGTAYLRVQMLSAARQPDIERQLQEYVDARVTLIRQPTPENIVTFLAESPQQFDQLWLQAKELMTEDPYSQANALFAAALNDVIDLHTERVILGQYRIPLVIWLGLYGMTMLAFAALGYQSAHSGRMPAGMKLASATIFAAVILLVQDLDQNNKGRLRLNHQPTIDLVEWMKQFPQ